MRALKWSFLGLVLGAASLAAQPALMVSPMSASTAPRAGEAASLLQDIVQGDRLLFFRIPADQMEAAARSFLIRLNVDGRPFTEETYHLDAGAPGPLTVELLGLAPGLLDNLYEKARGNDHKLGVTVLADGKVIAELSWEELLRINRQLRKGDFRPVAVPTELKSFFSPWPPPQPAAAARSSRARSGAKYYGPDPECSSQCSDQFYQCYYEDCDQRGSCAYCNDYYTSCMIYCPTVCIDPKKQEDITTSTVVAAQFTGNGGCYLATKGFGGGYNFMEYRLTVKNTTIRRTTYCNGTTSDQYLGDTYTYTYCYNRGTSCSNPLGYMYNEC